MEIIETLRWEGGPQGHLVIIDQTLLPTSFTEIKIQTVTDCWNAIKELKIRGAPAIGIAAAYGVVLGMQGVPGKDWERIKEETISYLASSRPTAVNLFWALERMRSVSEGLLDEAKKIQEEDDEICLQIGRIGAEFINEGDGILTHCNAGGLATSKHGTALSCMFAAHEQGKKFHVWVDETRPLLQGSRLTAWELKRRGIPCTLICDSMAAKVMKEGKIQSVIVGADRIASNGDVANKIGTYSVAVCAKHHDIPVFVAAPTSTFDMSLESGNEIPIEERDREEIVNGFGRITAPYQVHVYNPAFDVTPFKLVRTIFTEKGAMQATKWHIAQFIK